MMNPPAPRSRMQETRRVLAPYANLIVFTLGILIGFILSRV